MKEIHWSLAKDIAERQRLGTPDSTDQILQEYRQGDGDDEHQQRITVEPPQGMEQRLIHDEPDRAQANNRQPGREYKRQVHHPIEEIQEVTGKGYEVALGEVEKACRVPQQNNG